MEELHLQSQWWSYQFQDQFNDLQHEENVITDRNPFAKHALNHITHYATRLVYTNEAWRELFRADSILFGPRTAPDYKSELRFAVFYDLDGEVCRIFKSKSSAPSKDSICRSLCYACQSGSERLVEMLLDAGADTTEIYSLDTSKYFDKESLNCLGWAIMGKPYGDCAPALAADPES